MITALLRIAALVNVIGLAACGGLPAQDVDPAAGSLEGIAYLSPVDAPELWLSITGENQARRLTNIGGRLYDYSIAPGGKAIVYSVVNEQNGVDLWEIDGDPREAQPFHLLPCGADWCFNPVYSPDGSKIAYSRRKASGLPGSQPGLPQIWLIERDTLRTDVLFVDPSVTGHSPLWSPDGRYLAFVDDAHQGVRVVDFQSNEDFFIETGPGDSFSWSPDSLRLYLTRTETSGEYPTGSVFVVDAASQKVALWLGEEGEEYSAPAWSPDSALAAVSRRGYNQGAGRQLWLVGADGSVQQEITSDPRINHAGYAWNAEGSQLVYQRLDLSSSSSRPEVWIWNSAEGRSTRLAEDAFLPRWMP